MSINGWEFQKEWDEAEAQYRADYEKKKPSLVGRNIPELKKLWHKVNDKKWAISERDPLSGRDCEVMHRLTIYEVIIRDVISEKREREQNV